MNSWPIGLANGVGVQKPTPGAAGEMDATSIEQPRPLRSPESPARIDCKGGVGWPVMCAVGFVVPPYGLPPTDPTPSGFRPVVAISNLGPTATGSFASSRRAALAKPAGVGSHRPRTRATAFPLRPPALRALGTPAESRSEEVT